MKALFVLGPVKSVWQEILLAVSATGFDIVWSPRESLGAIAEQPFDVVFTDHHGLDALKAHPVPCSAMVFLQLDSVFYEMPFLIPMLKTGYARQETQFLYWVACPASKAFLDQAGFPMRSAYLPYPFSATEVVEFPPGTVCPAGAMADKCVSAETFLRRTLKDIPTADHGKIFFAGAYDDDASLVVAWQPDSPVSQADVARAAQAYAADHDGRIDLVPCAVRVIQEAGLKVTSGQALLVIKGIHHYLSKYRVVHERVPLVRRIAQVFGSDFILVGDGWDRAGLPHRPSNFNAGPPSTSWYRVSAICPDFGSTTLDIGWYDRSKEILKFGSRLLQRRTPDAKRLYGPHADALTFHNEDQMLTGLERGLSAGGGPDAFQVAERIAVLERLSSMWAPALIGPRIHEILEKIGVSPGSGARQGLRHRIEVALAAGEKTNALSLCRTALAAPGQTAGGLSAVSRLALQAGGGDIAALAAQAACRLDPDKPDHRSDLVLAQLASGRRAEALATAEATVQHWPDHTPTNLLLAQIRLPGPWYLDVLGWFHQLLQPDLYVEIGVMQGNSLSRARSGTRIVAIDPEPRLPPALVARVSLHSVTSNAFFETVRPLFPGERTDFDFAFVDGLHTFDQALLDLAHLEQVSHDRSVILLHDSIPLTEATATRTQDTEFWSGDTWKIVPLLNRFRPDLTLALIPTPPTGLLVVTGLDRTNRLLFEQQADLRREGLALSFDHRMEGWGVPFLANQPEAVAAHLQAAGIPPNPSAPALG